MLNIFLYRHFTKVKNNPLVILVILKCTLQSNKAIEPLFSVKKELVMNCKLGSKQFKLFKSLLEY